MNLINQPDPNSWLPLRPLWFKPLSLFSEEFFLCIAVLSVCPWEEGNSGAFYVAMLASSQDLLQTGFYFHQYVYQFIVKDTTQEHNMEEDHRMMFGVWGAFCPPWTSTCSPTQKHHTLIDFKVTNGFFGNEVSDWFWWLQGERLTAFML